MAKIPLPWPDDKILNPGDKPRLLGNRDALAQLADYFGVVPVGTVGVRHEVLDTNYVGQPQDAYIAVVSLTGPRVIYLPSAAVYPALRTLVISDESGLCSAATGLTLTIAASGSDTIGGQPVILLASPYQKVLLQSNGRNLWTV